MVGAPLDLRVGGDQHDSGDDDQERKENVKEVEKDNSASSPPALPGKR